MLGLGNSNSFEIDGVEFTIDGAFSAGWNDGKRIYKDGEVVQEIDKKAAVVPVDLPVNGEEYPVMLIFDTGGNLENAYVQGEEGEFDAASE